MTALRFDRARIEAFLQLVGERLDAEWLLVGGAAAAAWFSPGRTTEDIDLIGLGGTQSERFALMTLAAEASLPIEAVNSAADFFVRRISDWREHLVPLHRGSHATIYRPDATLFVLLKVNRLSETDLDDCLRLIAHCESTVTGEPFDRARALGTLAGLRATDDDAATERRRRLAAALGA